MARNELHGITSRGDTKKSCRQCFRVLEGKLAEAKSKKDTLKARSASAKTSKQIQEMIGNLDTSSSVAAFDKMEEKVVAG